MNEDTLQQQPVEQQAPQTSGPSEEEKQYNMRRLASERDEARRQAEALQQQLAQVMNMQQRPAPQEEDEPDDVYVDNRRFKQVRSKTKSLEEKNAELEQRLKDLEQRQATSYIKTRFNDFSNVVNDNNMEKFAQEEPALYASIMKNNDLSERGEALYSAISARKKRDTFNAESKQVDQRQFENRSMPRAAAGLAPAASTSPLASLSSYDRISMSRAEKEEQRKKFQESYKRIY